MILVFGRTGQVGSAIYELVRNRSCSNFVFLDRSEADFSIPDSLDEVISRLQPSWVINTVAYTGVDKAESDRDMANLVNADAVGVIAKACARIGARLIHFSTDYVYSGRGSEPFTESDEPAPVNFYGQSKLDGERKIIQNLSKYFILRTSWVYHEVGQNFVRTMLRLGAEKTELRVVSDQVGCPTAAKDLATTAMRIIEIQEATPENLSGIYNVAGQGETTWFGFAEEIFKICRARRLAFKLARLEKILTEDYQSPARRPLNSRLNQNKLRQVFGIVLPVWGDSLLDVLERLAPMP